jgi:hypothetical protein
MSLWDTGIATAVGAFVGGGVVLASNIQTARMAERRDRNEWERRRADIRTDEQRAAIKDLQDAISRYARTVAQIQHADTMLSRLGGVYGTARLEDGLAEASREAVGLVGRLESRVGDADLRALSEQVRTVGTLVVSAKVRDDALQGIATMSKLNEGFNERVSELLDKL